MTLPVFFNSVFTLSKDEFLKFPFLTPIAPSPVSDTEDNKWKHMLIKNNFWEKHIIFINTLLTFNFIFRQPLAYCDSVYSIHIRTFFMRFRRRKPNSFGTDVFLMRGRGFGGGYIGVIAFYGLFLVDGFRWGPVSQLAVFVRGHDAACTTLLFVNNHGSKRHADCTAKLRHTQEVKTRSRVLI